MNWTVEQEIAHKLAQMRRWLEQEGAGALRLRGVDWFAWATAPRVGIAHRPNAAMPRYWSPVTPPIS